MRRFLLPALLLAGCTAPAEKAGCPVLPVLAAQSLEAPLRAFAAGRVDVQLSFAASGQLVRQIELGAPAGLFLPAGEREAEAVVAMGRAVEKPLPFAENELLLVAAAEAPEIETAADLARPGLRVAIGRAPVVPAGRYGREALRLLGLEDRVAPQLVEAESAPQVLAWVRGGQVDAGLAYRSDVRAAGAGVRAVATLPTETPIRYPAVILDGPCVAEARAFLEALRGAEALQAHGL